jgi:predicted kinase
LAKDLARREHAVLLIQDELLAHLYPGEITGIAGFVKYSARLRAALTVPVQSLLANGVSVVLDFPGNTATQRHWFRELFEAATAAHELHFIDVPDETCKAQLRQRSKDLPEGSAWTTDAEFDAITAYFQAPAAEEGFNVIRHRRGG